MAGASCGLFVAAYMARTELDLLSSGWLVLLVMALGALGFYLGIDVPPAAEPPAPDSGPDRVEILSAGGTFLTALATLASALVVVTDAYPRLIWPAILLLAWLVGAVLQIVAGVIARCRA
jgi:hypothetical protein